MTLADRIRYVLELRGMSASELSKKAGLSRGAVKAMLARLDTNARASVTTDSLEKIANAANVAIAWLVRGEGELEASASHPEPGPRLANLEAALVYHPNRWHPDTIAAARRMRLYGNPKITPQTLEGMLDALDRTVRDIEAHIAKANADTHDILGSEPSQFQND